MEEVIKFSIIIPIYNTADKLRRCLESILEQDFADYECIMVDDGSKDGSGEIIDEYSELDNRFIAFHKQNGGVSSARNNGLDIARGEWLVFVDSDDFLLPNHLSAMYEAITDDVDLIMTGFRFLHSNYATEHNYSKGVYCNKDKISNFILYSDFLNWQIPWDRTYRNKHNVRFDENLSISEDRLFCYQYLLTCKGIATINKITYIHDGTDCSSLSYRAYPSSMNEYRHKVFKNVINELNKNYATSNLDKSVLTRYMDDIYTALINSYKVENKTFAFNITRLLHKLGVL